MQRRPAEKLRQRVVARRGIQVVRGEVGTASGALEELDQEGLGGGMARDLGQRITEKRLGLAIVGQRTGLQLGGLNQRVRHAFGRGLQRRAAHQPPGPAPEVSLLLGQLGQPARRRAVRREPKARPRAATAPCTSFRAERRRSARRRSAAPASASRPAASSVLRSWARAASASSLRSAEEATRSSAVSASAAPAESPSAAERSATPRRASIIEEVRPVSRCSSTRA